MKHLLVLLASVAAALLVCEAGLRIAGYSEPVVYQPDAERGYAPRPGAKGRWREEGDAYISISSQGLRDREHTLTPAPNTVRIAVLGDSFAEALQVPIEQTFWHVLERLVNERRCFGGHTAEVINFGVAGYGTAHELLTLRSHVWQYDPDVVLLAFYLGNDVANNHFALQRDANYPYFVLRHGRLVPVEGFPRQKWPMLRKAFSSMSSQVRLFGLLRRAAKGLDSWPPREPPTVPETNPGAGGEMYLPPMTKDWEDAWQVTEALIGTMGEEVVAHHARFVLATLAHDIVADPNPAVRQKYQQNLGVDDLFYGSRRLERFAERSGLRLVSLSEPFQEYAETRNVFLHGFPNSRLGRGHWNALGHQLAGELLAESICTLPATN